MYTPEKGEPPTYEVLRESAEGELEGREEGGMGKNFGRKVFNEKESSLNGTKSRGESDFFGSPLELGIFAAVTARRAVEILALRAMFKCAINILMRLLSSPRQKLLPA